METVAGLGAVVSRIYLKVGIHPSGERLYLHCARSGSFQRLSVSTCNGWRDDTFGKPAGGRAGREERACMWYHKQAQNTAC